jgi:hypothetical protein
VVASWLILDHQRSLLAGAHHELVFVVSMGARGRVW